MHIPDGYLSPATCFVAAAMAAPACAIASRRLRSRLGERQAPLLAVGSAFCFSIMMLNVPIPGGTTAHAVGGTLLAITLGPEAAILALTVTLFIQALFFGDGGILSLGANTLNMAVILPITGYAVYRSIVATPGGASHRGLPPALAAALGSYIGINLAALAAGVELGIQPALYHTSAGAPLYCPYSLSQTVPAMLLAHLTVAGGVEAAITGVVVARLGQAQPAVLEGKQGAGQALETWGWRAVAALVVLAPLGLLAPGSAFGELSAADLKKTLGHVPAGLQHLAGVWGHALLPDYGLPGANGGPGWEQAAGYWLSALAGIGLIVLCISIIRLMQRRQARFASLRGSLRTGQVGSLQPEGPLSSAAKYAPPSIPGWLLQTGGIEPLRMSGQRRRLSYVEKTLSDASGVVQASLFGEAICNLPGWIQSLDPRAKAVTLGLTIVAACLLRHVILVIGVGALATILAISTGIPAAVFVRRVFLAGTFTALAAAPAVFNWVTPGTALWVVARWGHPITLATAHLPDNLAITYPGVLTACLLVCRVLTSVALVLLLTLTTRWISLLRAFRALGIPRMFVFVLSMVYRYLFVLVQVTGDLFVARKSRSLSEGSTASGRQFIGAAITFLAIRSLSLSEEIYAAMVSRGFRGEPRILTEWKVRRRDWLWAIACAATWALLWIGDRFLG